MLEMSALKLFTVANLRYQLSSLPCYTLPPTQHHCFFRNLSSLLFCQLWWAKGIFLVSRQSNRPVINRIITSLVHELSPWSVDDTKKSENHFVVILSTDKTKATFVEEKADIKDAPLVGKLGSTEISKSLKDWVKWNLIYKGYFLKITCARILPSMWGDWADWILTKEFLNIELPRRSQGL